MTITTVDLLMNTKWLLGAPILLKGGAYLLLGVGSIANAFGYTDIASTCLGVAALFGIGDTVKTAQNQ